VPVSPLISQLKKNPLAGVEPPATGTAIALAGHPIHPTLVHFPIAFLIGALGCDLAFWWTADHFWARGALWLTGSGFAMGALAALIGTLEFMLVKEIRRFLTSWNHFLAGVMLVALAAANWWLRVGDAAAAVLPWGLFLSALNVVTLGLAGLLGGHLVYTHNIGTIGEEADDAQNGLPATKVTTPVINSAGASGSER
jgi:uncharacterized membrane protein